MTDHQAKARELLAIVERKNPPHYLYSYPCGHESINANDYWNGSPPDCVTPLYEGSFVKDLYTELRAALDENLALRAEVKRLKSPRLLDDTSLRSLIGGIGNEIHNFGCSHQGNDEIARVTADLAGRLWSLAKQCSAEPASAFTGRRTARNDPTIPTDAGVPPREMDAGYGEGWSVEPLGTFARDVDAERGIAWPDAMANDPEGRMTEDDAVSRAIGQPGSKA